MVKVDLKQLIRKLNPICRETLESAAGLCLSRTNYNVEIEHWLYRLAEQPGTDFAAILRHFEIDSSRVLEDLNRNLDRLKTGNSRPPAFSPSTVDLANAAWMLASVNYGADTVRSGHLLHALLLDDALSFAAHRASPLFESISIDKLATGFASITAKSSEQHVETESGSSPAGVIVPRSRKALNQFTIDLTERARSGQIDPVLCREREVRQVIDILSRRRQNNPILTGEAGVGKTAIAEGFALRIAAGDVPASLKDVELRTLDLGLLQAGAGMKGEFENRLKSVIDEVRASPKPIILFIDEAHTMIGAGGAAGQGDAANLLKPALARGELRTIAATTWAEYKKYFEKDAALARRFQVVKVDEPDELNAVRMMRGLADMLQSHHKVRILDEAFIESVRLSQRYLSGRQLPDKSVSLLDTAAARVAMSQQTTPPQIEDSRWRIQHLKVEIDILKRESAYGADHANQIAELQAQKQQVETELQELEQRWEKERELAAQIMEVQASLTELIASDADSEGGEGDGAAPPISAADAERNAEAAAKLRQQLSELEGSLSEIQGEQPLTQVSVDAQAIGEIVSSWTGIPVGRMLSDEITTILNLKERMQERIVGQDHALEAIAQSIRTSRAQMSDPRKPIGVFLLVGTSGTGKTETALTLADLLYGGDQNMTVINMSEFKEEHKVSLLMGSPPGYVGYGEGGVLTEAVRRRPYSVVLLDEIEKAHPGVQDIFYQVFDKGSLRDGEGRDIDFRNTVILMTSNVGTDLIASLCADPATAPDSEALAEALHPELLQSFRPAFLGRLTMVPYFPLSDEVIRQIVELQLGRVKDRVLESYGAEFTYGPELVAAITDRCLESDSGARKIDHVLSRSLLPEISNEFLSRLSRGEPIQKAHISLDENGEFTYSLS